MRMNWSTPPRRTRSKEAILRGPLMAGVRPGVNHKKSKAPDVAKAPPTILRTGFFIAKLVTTIRRSFSLAALFPYHGQLFRNRIREGLPTIRPECGGGVVSTSYEKH